MDELGSPVSIQAQTVLFGTAFASLQRAVASLGQAARVAVAAALCAPVLLRYGDSGAAPSLTADQLAELREAAGHALAIDYVWFGANLGSAGGQNRLAESAGADYLLMLNPDVVVAANLFGQLLAPFRNDDVGIVEAKQLPFEHPKDYDPASGETSWATGACFLIRRSTFRRLGGFDADSFFLYCDDVDLSWRVRSLGLKVVFQPSALAFHDKRLSDDGRWQPGHPERYYSAEAALLLPHKWSRPDLVDRRLAAFSASTDPLLLRAAAAFRERRRNGRLPPPTDPQRRIGQFVGDQYAHHRFAFA
jgi:GT2 family glycosyltransferase